MLVKTANTFEIDKLISKKNMSIVETTLLLVIMTKTLDAQFLCNITKFCVNSTIHNVS